MTKRLFLFILWTAVLTSGALAAAWLGWSPYADASGRHQTPGGHGGYGGGRFYGPMHK